MNVHEYQAAAILARHGIPVNPGEVATTPDEAEAIARRAGGLVVVKAQVHTGGRGKAGGVALARTPEEARAAGERILGMDIRGHTVHKVLVASGVDIGQEFYLGVVLDRPERRVLVMASAEGGMDIEEVARERPERIVRELADPLLGLRPYQAREIGFALGVPADKVAGFAAIAGKLYETYVAEDATLCEINPLVLTKPG